jgi:hypothetical protein
MAIFTVLLDIHVLFLLSEIFFSRILLCFTPAIDLEHISDSFEAYVLAF